MEPLSYPPQGHVSKSHRGDRELEDVQVKYPRWWVTRAKAEGYLLAYHLVWPLQLQSEPSTVLEIGSLMN